MFQDLIGTEVKILLALKNEYKSVAGKDWKPDDQPTVVQPAATSSAGMDAVKLNEQIGEQGNKVRDLKSAKAAKV